MRPATDRLVTAEDPFEPHPRPGGHPWFDTARSYWAEKFLAG